MRRLALPALVVLASLVAAACNTAEPEKGSSTLASAAATAPASSEADGDSGTCAPGSHHGAAGHGTHAKADREQVDADGVVRRGSPLTADLAPTPVSVAVEKARELDGKKVKLTGTVSDVCTRMGCWFVVQGEKPEDKIRISTKAHNIFVPRSAVGMTATVEGTLLVKVLDAKTAQHYEDERELQAGEERKTITSDVNELAIDVVGLEMKKQG